MKFKEIIKREKINFKAKCRAHMATDYTFCEKCGAPVKAYYKKNKLQSMYPIPIKEIEMGYVFFNSSHILCLDCLLQQTAFDRDAYHLIYEEGFIMI